MLFLQVPVIIIIRFGENNVLGQICINKYIKFVGGRGWPVRDKHGLSYISCFTLLKNGNISRTRPILNSNSTLVLSNIFFTVNNKKVTKMGNGGPSQFF